MNTASCRSLTVIAVLAGVLLPTGGIAARAEETSPGLRAGFGTAEITPPTPNFRMSGYFSERINSGTHDPLMAKAMFLEQGDVRAVVVVCDILNLIREVTDPARARIAEVLGVPPENCVITATHAHTGPVYHGPFHRLFSTRPSEVPYPDMEAYLVFLVERIVLAARNAHQALEPVSLRHGYVMEDTLSFNRRFYMRNGTVVFNPGRLNPEIVKVAGPIDPQAGLLAFTKPGAAQPHALFTTFSLHLDTVGGTEYSADYPYYLQEGLRSRIGAGFFSMFGLGPTGDINHINVSQADPPTGVEAERIGARLAETVSSGLGGLSDTPAPRLAVARSVVEVPLQTTTPEDLAWAEEMLPRLAADDFPFLDRVKVLRILDLAAYNMASIPIEVQVIALSEDAAMVFLPGEVFVELCLAIKNASPYAHTLVVELANDCPSYIPTAKAYEEGSYEVDNSRVCKGGGEAMVEAARRLLYKMKYPE